MHFNSSDYASGVDHGSPERSGTGFTLVEVLIALVVLSTAVAGWMYSQQAAVFNRGQSRTMTVAAELVQAEMEKLSLNPDEMYSQACPGRVPLTETCENQETLTVGGFDYTISWELQKISDFVDESRPFWEIQVQAAWNYRGPKNITAEKLAMER
ncbi:MAG: type IV pilus modification PilV family protein [Desulfonatronovibrionaceae bacterium]